MSLKKVLDAVMNPKPPKVPEQVMPENIPPFHIMMRNLIDLSDDVYGRYAFSRDPLRGKFSFKKIDELTKFSVNCGEEYAEKIANEFGTRRPELIAEHLNIEVDYPRMPKNTDRVTFAHFVPPNKISVFTDCLDKAEEIFADSKVKSVMGNINISQILLAHELFHFIEDKYKNEIFTRLQKVELWAPWPFHNRSTIRCLSEIAGMSFARKLLELPYSVFILDVFLVYGYAKVPACCLYEEIMEIADAMKVEERDL